MAERGNLDYDDIGADVRQGATNGTKVFYTDGTFTTGNTPVYLGDGTAHDSGKSLATLQAYDIGCFVPGKPTNGQTIMLLTFVRPVTFLPNFSGAKGVIDPTNGANPTASATCSIDKVSGATASSLGSVVISTGGTFTFSTVGGAAPSFATGDAIAIYAPNPADATLSNFNLMLPGTR